MDKIRCVAYCRVSTNSKEQNNSLENQKSYFQREIIKNGNYEFVGIYADRGISGTKLKRPEFDKMLVDAGLDIVKATNNDNDSRKEMIKYITVRSSTRKPKFDKILVKNTSRFARNILVEGILRDLALNGVFVHFLDLDKCTDNDQDITLIQLFLTFDENESRDRSKKVIFGLQEAAKRGVIRLGHEIYGYDYIQSENCLEIIEKEASVVREIFKLYSENLGVRRIIKQLNSNNIKNRKGKEFSRSSIEYILKNEKYMGKSIRNKYDHGTVFNKNGHVKIRPEDNWIDIGKTDKIPAIISESLFNKCKELMKNKVDSLRQKGIYKGTTEYAGKIFCSNCGSTYWSNINRGKRFYKCKGKREKGECNNPNVSVEELDKATSNENYIGEVKSMAIIYTRQLKKLIVKLKERINKSDTEKVTELKDNLKKLTLKKERYVEMYAENKIDKTYFDNKNNLVDNDINKIQNLIKEFSKHNDDILQDIIAIENTIKKINENGMKLDYSRKEILDDIEKIIIHKDRHIEVIFKSVMLFRKLRDKHNIYELD